MAANHKLLRELTTNVPVKQQHVLVETNPAKTVNSYMYIVAQYGFGFISNPVILFENEQKIIA